MTNKPITHAKVTMRHALAVAGLLALSPAIALGQANPDSVHLRNDCRLAAQVLRTGQPANKKDWALGLIPSCGATGTAALADVWRANETSTDTALLFQLRRAAMHLADGPLFTTFLGTAGSGTASPSARVEAWRYLFRFTNPGVFLADDQLDVTPVDRLCAVSYFTLANPVPVSPLPVDFKNQVDQLAVQVAGDPSQTRVQRFASCVHQFINYSRTNP